MWRKFGPNPLDQELKFAAKNKHRTFLIFWNRGLGDIALGLYALVTQIRKYIPDAQITFVTRKDLEEGFKFLKGVDILVAADWMRGKSPHLEETMKALGVDPSTFDVVLENPDPTYWLKWQLGSLVPLLCWNEQWDKAWKKYGIDGSKTYVGVHVQTETKYPYEKNWLVKKWTHLFEKLHDEYGLNIILFGFQPTNSFPLPSVIDLRGKTNLFEMLSIIKNCSSYLIVPDSGVLSFTYYLDVTFPIRIVSLWSDPNQGVLKQAVPSPNPQLVHVPLIGRQNDISNIEVDDVIEALLRK